MAALNFAEVADQFNDGWGRGGCRSRYSSLEENVYSISQCNGTMDNNSDEGYCPFYKEYFNEDEWEEHFEACPSHNIEF